MAADPYLIKGTNVLANKLGLKENAALSKAEAEVSAARIQQLEKSPINGDFDFKHLQATHKHIFQDVYSWAGQSRTIRMGKSESTLDGKSVNYPDPNDSFPPNNLQARADYAFDELARDSFLQNLPRQQFVEKFAKHTAEIWEVHAFREGNTRATLTFMRQLAKEAGHELVGTMGDTPKDVRNALVTAAARADYEPLKLMVAKSLEPTRDLSTELKSIKETDPPRYKSISDAANQAKTDAKLKYTDPAEQQQFISEKVGNAVDEQSQNSDIAKGQEQTKNIDHSDDEYQL